MDSISAAPKTNAPLLAILLVFAALAVAYSLALPIRYGPDEPAHFIYVRSLATDKTPPPIAHTETPNVRSTDTHEGHQPPLYYTLMAIPFGIMKAAGLSRMEIWRVLRLLNVPLGVLWVWLIYRLASSYFRRSGYALVATAFVALIPTAPYTAAVVNNENLISVMFTWSLIPMLEFFRNGRLSTRSAVVLGLLMGLAILAKAQGLVLLPLVVIAAVCAMRREEYANWREALKTCAISLGVAAVVSGWWFVRCWYVEGALMPHSLYRPVLVTGLADLVFTPIWAIELITVCSAALYGYFWTPYWLLGPLHLGFARYFTALVVLSIIGLAGFVARLRRKDDLDRRSLAFLLTAPVLLYLSWLRYVLVVDSSANLQGRLLLSSAGVLGIAAALGFDGLLRSSRAKKVAVVAGTTAMLAANLVVMWSTVMTYRA